MANDLCSKQKERFDDEQVKGEIHLFFIGIILIKKLFNREAWRISTQVIQITDSFNLPKAYQTCVIVTHGESQLWFNKKEHTGDINK